VKKTLQENPIANWKKKAEMKTKKSEKLCRKCVKKTLEENPIANSYCKLGGGNENEKI